MTEPNQRDSGRNAWKDERGQHSLHPAWRAFMRYCAQLQHGDIERLSIQDGVPVFAELTTKKVKFTS
jgi:hypothetical protein